MFNISHMTHSYVADCVLSFSDSFTHIFKNQSLLVEACSAPKSLQSPGSYFVGKLIQLVKNQHIIVFSLVLRVLKIAPGKKSQKTPKNIWGLAYFRCPSDIFFFLK